MRGRLWLQCVECSSKLYIINFTIAEAYAVWKVVKFNRDLGIQILF